MIKKSLILNGIGNFVVANNTIRTTNGETFYLDSDENSLRLSIDEPMGNVSGCGNVIVGNNITSVNGVSISTSGNDIYIKTRKSGRVFVNDVLMTESDAKAGANQDDQKIKEFDISSFEIDEIKVSGSGSLKIIDINIAEDLDVKLSGQGSIEASNISTTYLDVKISGQGNINLNSCSAKKANFKVSGMGNISGVNNSFDKVTEKVSGMGNINL